MTPSDWGMVAAGIRDFLIFAGIGLAICLANKYDKFWDRD